MISLAFCLKFFVCFLVLKGLNFSVFKSMKKKKEKKVKCICLGSQQYFIILTLKAPITTALDDIHKYFFIFFFQRK